MNAFIWLLTALSLLGVVLNVLKLQACFGVWIFTNAAWAMITFNVARGRLKPVAVLPMFPLYCVYLVLAVWGLVEWQ